MTASFCPAATVTGLAAARAARARTRGAVALFASLLAQPLAAVASPLGMYGYGSRSTALGGAVSADVDDFSANYYNPAGLARARSVRIDLGYLYAAHHLTVNGLDSHVDPVHGISGGIVAPGTLFGLRFAFGLGIHLPDDQLSLARSLPQQQPRWELYGNTAQILYITANIALQPLPWLRVGGGLSFVSATQGQLDIYGNFSITNAAQSDVHHAINADLLAVRYPQFGAQIDLLPNLTLALVYRGQFQLSLDVAAAVQGNIVLGDVMTGILIPAAYDLHSQSSTVFLPQQAVAGLAWRALPSLSLLADVTWIDWSAYPNPSGHLTTALSVQPPPGVALPIPAIPPAVAVLDAGFHNTFVPRFGAEWRRGVGAHTLSLRLGYRYDASPIPNQSGGTNFLDANRHVVSTGVGFLVRGLQPVLRGGVSFDVHGEVQLLENREMTKSNPADPVGDYVVGGQVYNFGMTLGLLF